MFAKNSWGVTIAFALDGEEYTVIFRGGGGMAAGHTNVLLTSVIIFINIEILYTWSNI
jgi:hypothetical protein